jgi:hypothetical protein
MAISLPSNTVGDAAVSDTRPPQCWPKASMALSKAGTRRSSTVAARGLQSSTSPNSIASKRAIVADGGSERGGRSALATGSRTASVTLASALYRRRSTWFAIAAAAHSGLQAARITGAKRELARSGVPAKNRHHTDIECITALR